MGTPRPLLPMLLAMVEREEEGGEGEGEGSKEEGAEAEAEEEELVVEARFKGGIMGSGGRGEEQEGLPGGRVEWK